MLRPATMDDVPAIELLVAAAYAVYVPRMGMQPKPMLDDYGRRVAAHQAWVVADTGVQAVLVMEDAADYLLVENVAVQPERQSQGLGGRLLAFAEEQARSRGYAELRLYTNELMAENRAMYTHLGYREVGRESINGRRAVWFAKRVG